MLCPIVFEGGWDFFSLPFSPYGRRMYTLHHEVCHALHALTSGTVNRPVDFPLDCSCGFRLISCSLRFCHQSLPSSLVYERCLLPPRTSAFNYVPTANSRNHTPPTLPPSSSLTSIECPSVARARKHQAWRVVLCQSVKRGHRR